ncbi:NUDIX hydrolase [Candidatus Protofrankia californiensis]|uniref:NUDIX hydrolase n=1 Tax=Candidatus Protofrankia californiensis TaxID=1839754 RepID=UPI001041B4D0|nr:NUDIX hydrolase [Candidatus Protofrankia californiensis]
MADLTGRPTQDLLTALRQRVPPALAQRAAAFRPGHDQPAPTRDAATVALIQDTGSGTGVQVCLLRRVSTMAFAAGMHVFPGGTVDPADVSTEPRWFGTPEVDTVQALGAEPALARALVCAAVRETFEESGVLLAGPDTDTVADVTDPSWESDRLALEGRQLSMASLLARRGLGLRVDLLRPWARWVTPEIEPRRYDTRFFVASMPAEQRTRPIPGESDRMLWMPPGAALAEHLAGRLAMMPPTVHTLMELAEHDTVAAVLAAARIRDTRPVRPRILVRDGEARLLLPHDDGYDSTPGLPGPGT